MRIALRRAGALLSMGQLIMIATLFGLLVLIVGLVLRFDPEARAERPDRGS